MKKLLCEMLLMSTLVGCTSNRPLGLNDDGTRDIPGKVIYFKDDDKPAYYVTCNNYSSWEACENRAAAICTDYGYDELHVHKEDFIPFVKPIYMVEKNLTFRCHTESGLYPGDERLPMVPKNEDP